MSISLKERRIRRILEVYGDALYRLAYSYLFNDADSKDVVQETILQLLRYDPTFADLEKEKGWLMKTCANASRNRLRFNRNHQTDELDERLRQEEKEDLSFVWEAVKQLNETEREVIHLFYQEGYQTKEIAEILNRKESTIRSDLKRAREKLKEILKEAYDFEE